MIWLALPAFAAPPDWWFAAPPGFRPIRAEPPALWAFGNEAGTALVVRWEDTTTTPLPPGHQERVVGAGRFVVESSGRPAPDAVDTLLATAGPGLEAAAVVRSCAVPCAGTESLTLFRDASGAVQRVRFRGDLQQCSHVATVWWDAAGNQLLVANDKPKSEEALAAHAKAVAAVEAGLLAAGPFPCGWVGPR